MQLTPSQKEWRAKARSFVDREIAPFAAGFDRNGSIPRSIIDSVAGQGYFGVLVPREYQGGGMSMIEFGILNEEFGRACSSLRSLLTVQAMVASAISKWGNDAQRREWLPSLATGQRIAAFALSEPDAGSNIDEIQTKCVSESADFLVSGHKRWITFGQMADVFLVFAKSEGGGCALLIDRHSPGLSILPIEGMLGVRGSMLADVVLKSCRVSKESLIGRSGFGLSHVASFALDLGRFSVAWGCVGISQACLDASLRYAATRTQFGKRLQEHQLIQRMLTKMIAGTEASRLLCLQAALLKNSGDVEAILQTLIAKYFASTQAMEAASDAVQIHGANGCSPQYPVERYFRDAKIMQIIEGSAEIQEITIAASSR